MDKVYAQYKKLEEFTKKVLEYSLKDAIVKDGKEFFFYKNGMYHPDIYIETKEDKYVVEVKSSLNYAYTKLDYLIREFEGLDKSGYKPILIVYDKIREIINDKIKDKIEVLDISNILYLIRNNEELMNELMGLLNYSIENIKQEKPKWNLKSKATKKEISKTDEKSALERIEPGDKDKYIYQDFCVNTLEKLFADKLTFIKEQNKTDEGINVFDLICKIKIDIEDEFFETIEKYFKSKYIVFEFKNYQESITQYQVCTTEKYLYETALRKVAIIITRKGINDNGTRMIKGILRETGKLIIVLDDKDFKKMIDLRERGEEPSKVLTEKLDDLLTHLEK